MSSAAKDDDSISGISDRSNFASKFSIYGCVVIVSLLSFLAVACHMLDRFNYNFKSDSSLTTLVEVGIKSRSLLTAAAKDIDHNIDTDALPTASEVNDIDCGEIFLLASQNIQESNYQYSNRSARLCHYARNCKSGGWPSRILLPLILCQGATNDNDAGSLANGTNGSNLSKSATKMTSPISTTVLIVLLFLPLLLYLFLLFRLLATTADNYFSPSLETFSFELGLPPRFAGATLLALGNGSPDLGSTVNAILLWNEKEANNVAADSMETQGWTMSLGDLIGGGMFVGTVVCGLLINQCSGIQCRVAFVRDVTMYAFSVAYVWHVLESKRVTQANALGLLGIYVIYVCIVFCADVFHRKFTVERINMEAKERRKSIIAEKTSRLSQLYDAMRGDNSNLGVNADELTPMVPYTSKLPSYIDDDDDEGEEAVNEDQDIIPDILPLVSESFEKLFPRPRLSITDRVAMFMSNYDPSSVRHIGSSSTMTDESKDSELGTIYTMIHDTRPPILRAISPPLLPEIPTPSRAVDDSSTRVADEALLEQDTTPRRRNIPSPSPSDTSSIAPKGRSWSVELFIDAYEELVFQSHHFKENSFHSANSVLEKIGTSLEMPFSIARVLTIPLPVEDHYCRPIVALSTACSSIWVLYYWEKDFVAVSSTLFILISLIMALAILRYADESKMPLVTSIPLSLYGFLIAATWIDTIGSALVDLLQFFGIILRIPPGILGMTVLAIGNSMGDLSSNLAMARNGLPNMATTAVFAGPAFNLLVGVGCGFLALQRKLDTPVISPVTLNSNIRTGFTFIIINCVAIALCGMLCQWTVPKRYSNVLFAWYALFILFTLNSFVGQLR